MLRFNNYVAKEMMLTAKEKTFPILDYTFIGSHKLTSALRLSVLLYQDAPSDEGSLPAYPG
jgi:hypothetical protein